MIHFIFIVPVHPKHRIYIDQWEFGLDVQKYPREYRLNVLDENKQGQVYWINHFLDRITSNDVHLQKNTYINFHGIDDCLKDNVLYKLSEIIEGNNHPAWLYGGHFTAPKRTLAIHKAQDFDLKRLKWKNYIAGGAVFVRADVYKDRRFRDLAFGQGADWDMWLRIGQEHEPLVLKDLLIYTERLGTSTIRSRPGKLSTKIFNRIKYPIWRVQRCFKK